MNRRYVVHGKWGRQVVEEESYLAEYLTDEELPRDPKVKVRKVDRGTERTGAGSATRTEGRAGKDRR